LSQILGPGSLIAGYRLEAVLGRGGMGVVYRAHDVRLGRTVAVKLLAPELTGEHGLRELLLNEARIAARLDHPNIVAVHDAIETDTGILIVMRLIPGGDLAQALVRDGRMGPERALSITRQVATALQAAHDAGVVHGDLKPANILLDESVAGTADRAYLADFGLSRMLTTASPRSDSTAGTLLYTAPEQLRGEPTDERSDIYSLGCVLYQCLAGTPPFRGSDSEVVLGHLEQAPSPLSDLDPPLSAVISRALAKNPSDRFGSAAALGAALGEAGRRSDAGHPPDAAPSSRRRWIRTPAALAVSAGLGVCLIAGALLVAHLRGSSSGEAPFHARVSAERLIGDRRSLLAAGPQGLFIAAATGAATGSVERIDPASLRPVAYPSWPIGRPLGFSTGSRVVWVVSQLGQPSHVVIERITSNGERQRTQLAGTPPCARLPDVNCNPLIVGGNAWLAFGSHLVQVGGPTMQVEGTRRIGGSIIDLAYGAGWLWVGVGSSLVRIDPVHGNTLAIDIASGLPAGGEIAHVVASGSDVWVSYVYPDPHQDVLVHVVAGQGRPIASQIVALPDVGALLALADGSLWVSETRDGAEVLRLDAHTGRVTGPSVTVPDTVTSIRASKATLWLMTFRLADHTRRLYRVALT
jgi:hypothetical protein